MPGLSRSERVAAWVWDRRGWLAAACGLVTLVAASQAATVGVDNSLRVWFLDDDPGLVSYRTYQERFGSDEVVLVVFQRDGGIADGEGLELLRRAGAALSGVDGVATVVSIADYAEAVRRLDRLVPSLDGGSPGLDDETVRRKILADPELRDRLVSRDGSTAAMVVRMRAGDDLDARRDAVVRDIEQALRALGEPAHLAGIGVLYVALNRLAVTDAAVLFGLCIAALFALLRLVYQRTLPAVATLGVAVLTMVWALGLYGALGRDQNMITTAMPSVLLVVATAEMVHILLHAAGQPQHGSRRERAVAILGHMLPPSLLNILTSALGFAALATSPLPAVRDLGMFTAAGLLGCMVLTVVAAAFVLGSSRWEPRAGGNPALRRAAAYLGEVGIRHPVCTLTVAAAVTLGAAAAATRVDVDTFTIGFLDRAHPVRRDSDFIEAHLGPYVPMEFLVRAADGTVTPDLLAAIERWQAAGARIDGVGWSRSPAAWLRTYGEQVPAEVSFDRRLDAYRASAAAALDPRLDADGTVRVTFSVRMQSARGVDRIMQALLAQAQLPVGATVKAAGYLPLYVRMIGYVVESQVNGFAFAFVTVFGVIALAFRSAKIALLAVPSNLAPLVLILGVMGVAAINLDAATVTIAAVVLGLVVDDSVHFLHRLRGELARHADPAAALRAAVAGTGHAILATALVMSLAFSVFAASEIKSLVYFGLLIALALATSVLTDLMVIPALVMLRRAAARREPALEAP